MKLQLKEFYAKQGYTPTFKTKDGLKVEVEYNKEFGKANALHLIMLHPTLAIVQYFLDELSIAINSFDYQSRTPFSIGIDF